MAFSTEIDIHFHQCDPAGVLFYGEAFSISHNAYERFLKTKVRCHDEVFSNTELAFPIRSTAAEFQAPVRLGEASVELGVAHVGDSSFTLEFKVFQQRRLCFTVRTTHVTISKASGKKAAIPQKLRQQLVAEAPAPS